MKLHVNDYNLCDVKGDNFGFSRTSAVVIDADSVFSEKELRQIIEVGYQLLFFFASIYTPYY